MGGAEVAIRNTDYLKKRLEFANRHFCPPTHNHLIFMSS